MLYSSFVFIFVFLPLVTFLYYIFKNRIVRNVILCVSSLIFYAWGEPSYIFLMLGTILLNYYFAILIDKYKNKKKIFMFLTVIFDLGLLCLFKYSNFFMSTVNSIFNIKVPLLNISLPIGISFYTFQVLSYVIDVYRGDVKVQRNLLNLATYVSLFPQLVAGPIVRYQTIADELENRRESLDLFVSGMKRFMVGFAKKVLIANNMALIVDTMYSDIYQLGTLSLWFAAIMYTFQIYFDFSGYSDMSLGLGKMFGFNFLENFNYPYTACSITDFWRRWHISLGSWFRDYVYIPLGGNKVSKFKWCRNLLIVWSLTGLWHGASWNFVIWGLYYGVILMAEKLFLLNLLKKVPKVIRYFYTMILVVIGWTIFRLENINDLLYALGHMLSFTNLSFIKYVLEHYDIMTSLPYVFFAIVGSFPIYNNFITKNKNNKLISIINDMFIYMVYIISILFLVSSTYNPFIYFRF